MELWYSQDMSRYTFIDQRVLPLDDRVAIALIMLNSGEPPEVVGSSVGVEESTVWRVTGSFIEAMLERARHNLRWPDLLEMGMIKSKFDRIHGLANCCGVLHTTHIKICPSSPEPIYEVLVNNEKNYSMGLLVIIDPDMRVIDFMIRPGSEKESTMLPNYGLFKACEKGVALNGVKLKLSSDGSEEVGEYVIGDSGFPLLPWLLTPYPLEKEDLPAHLPPSQAKFNRRHSEATSIAVRALARLKDTWKILHGMVMWHPNNASTLHGIIIVCILLHNIKIDMEGASMKDAPLPSDRELNYSKKVRQLGDEDAVRARDILAQHLLVSVSSNSPVLLEDQGEEKGFSSIAGDQEGDQQVAYSASRDQDEQEAVSSAARDQEEDQLQVTSSISRDEGKKKEQLLATEKRRSSSPPNLTEPNRRKL